MTAYSMVYYGYYAYQYYPIVMFVLHFVSNYYS